MIKDTDEFLEIIRGTNPNGLIASLDVESLFTNVPIEPTIEIICDSVYEHPSLPPPFFSRRVLGDLLRACTAEAPFRHIDGSLYLQHDGVAMGSPLGCTFANFYMCDLENRILADPAIKPLTYCRYVDDTFVVVRNHDHLTLLRTAMERSSVLKFTFELSIDQKIPFLDVNVDGSSGHYKTSVYKKQTDAGKCLNARSECPQRYKSGVIHALLHRAFKISSEWTAFALEVDRIKQVLINNGYSNTLFDSMLRSFLSRIAQPPPVAETNGVTHTVYYCNQMSSAYKTDERILKSIVTNNTRCTHPDDTLKLVIYYTNRKTSSMVMKNNLTSSPDPLRQTNVVYSYKCTIGDCALQNVNYIGETTTTLSKRISGHLQTGAPKQHTLTAHNTDLSRLQMVQNTTILYHASDFHRLTIMEALLIRQDKPIINLQDTGTIRTLQLFTNYNPGRPPDH